jgi:hypothetical protein
MTGKKREILEDAGVLFPSAITNGDRIRAMADEELAEWVWSAESSGRAYGPRGKNAWLNWLKSPVEVDE